MSERILPKSRCLRIPWTVILSMTKNSDTTVYESSRRSVTCQNTLINPNVYFVRFVAAIRKIKGNQWFHGLGLIVGEHIQLKKAGKLQHEYTFIEKNMII